MSDWLKGSTVHIIAVDVIKRHWFCVVTVLITLHFACLRAASPSPTGGFAGGAPDAVCGAESFRPDTPSAFGKPSMQDFPEGNYPEGLRHAWKDFTSNGHYRMARQDEFSERAQRHPEGQGIFMLLLFDINLDGGFGDFAVIVVDNQRSDPARFGLVIFSNPGGGSFYKAGWVLRHKDLSRMVLSRASARLVLTEYRDDGSEHSCFVHWHQSQGRYRCE